MARTGYVLKDVVGPMGVQGREVKYCQRDHCLTGLTIPSIVYTCFITSKVTLLQEGNTLWLKGNVVVVNVSKKPSKHCDN